MFFVWSLVAILLSLLLVVGFHEAGHALAARFFSVKIKRISIGFGKSLLCWQRKGGCEWVWAMWPLGGYVHLLNSRIEPVASQAYPHCFDKKSVWVRILILISGSMVNLLIAWLAFMLISLLGYQQSPPVIATVSSSSIAATSGLIAGDRFVAINGQNTASWREVGMRLIMTLGQHDVLAVVENAAGIQRQTRLDLSLWQYRPQKNALFAGLGIKPDFSLSLQNQVRGIPFFQACYQSCLQMIQLLSFFLVMLKQLVIGAIPFAVLLGPLGMLAAMVSSFTQGVVIFLNFIASLSIAVAIINLFPLPGLDGGSIVYVLVEKIRGKPASVGLEVLLHRLTFIVFCVFLMQLLVNDLQRYLH